MLLLVLTTTTPFGKAQVLEEVTLPQNAGTKRLSSRVQLLETADGQRLVRFSYVTGDAGRRGPVTLRAIDVRRLWEKLERASLLQEALRP
jgi:hypothetical protein